MTDVIVDPVVPAGEPKPSEATTEPWKEYGFDSAKAMAEEFAKQKADIAKYKPGSRKATELEAKLALLQKAEDDRAAAELSDLDREKKAVADSKDELAKLQLQYDKALKDNICERAISKRLGEYAETDRDLVRSLYDTVGEWADEEELNGLLDTIDTKWKAHLDALGGDNRPDVGGSSRGRSTSLSPVTKDEVVLAGDLVEGGAAALMKRRFGNK